MTTLITEYLELRPLPEADIPRLWKVYQGTPLYFDGLGMHVEQLNLEHVRQQWQTAQQQAGRMLFGIYHTVTGLLIGAADVQLDTPRQGTGAIWLLIWGGFQRQGYGQECMAALEHWLLTDQGMTTLCAIASANEEGMSFLELQGFQRSNAPAPTPVGRGASFWMCW